MKLIESLSRSFMDIKMNLLTIQQYKHTVPVTKCLVDS